MSWLTYDLPYPQNVYQFEDQAGITRTPFFMGYRGQLQRWKNSWRVYRLEFLLEGSKLRNLESWFWEYYMQSYPLGGQNGYRWQLYPLISESNSYYPTVNADPPEQYARPIEAPVITAIGTGHDSGLYRVTFAVETRYDGDPPGTPQQLPVIPDAPQQLPS